MNKYVKGILAGLTATIVLSVLMVLKAMMGIMPALDLPGMIAGMMGVPDQRIVGWVVHFMIGVVLYGLAIASFATAGNAVGRGVLIGFVGWVIMMLMLMPMVGAGFFGLNMGVMAPLMTLVLHLIFGAVLGWTYQRLVINGVGPTSAYV